MNATGTVMDSLMEDFARLIPSEASPDGLGGHDQTWTDGAPFRAFLREERTGETREAQRMIEAPRLLLVVSGDVSLAYHDIVKRQSDGAVFRLLSDTENRRTPAMSAVHIAAAVCERWALQ